MQNETEKDLLRQIAYQFPNQMIEVVPHVIPIEIPIDPHYGKTNYQSHILFGDMKYFLLKKIVSRFMVGEIRIIRLHSGKGPQIKYSAPGWLHYCLDTSRLEPALLLQPDAPWMLTVDCGYTTETTVDKTIQIALIGERVVTP